MANITMSGLGSGLPYDTWIEELCAVKQKNIDKVSAQVTSTKKQESAISTIEDDYTRLLNAIDTFTSRISSSDIFNQKSTTTSNSAVTASVKYTATNGSFSVDVSQLATKSSAESTYTVSSNIDRSTNLSDIDEGAVKNGTFTIYVNGTKNTLTTTTGETLGTLLDSINSLGGGVTASVENGKVKISGSSTTSITVGSSSDTSNLASVLGFEASTTTTITTTEGTVTTTSVVSYTGTNLVTDTNTSTAITGTHFTDSNGNDVSVREGTFSIGGVQFTIDSGTSLDSLVSQINKSNAGVTAAWDSNAGKLVLTSNDTGASSIDVEAGTSNFTDVMGLTTSSWSTTTSTTTTEGSVTTTTTYNLTSTSLNGNAQTLGQNAKFKINGTSLTSSSNTVSSDISGLNGVTLTLNSTTAATSATISVSTDTSKIESSLSTLVSSINSLIADTDSATSSIGTLYGDQILKSLRNRIRALVTTNVNGVSLSSLGISTGEIGSTTITNQFTISTTKMETFLSSSDNLDKLKTLLRGSTGSTTTTVGILTQMETVVENATDKSHGYFTTKEGSLDDEVDRLNDKIDRMTRSLESYYSQLEVKFSAMDKLISNLQSEASTFDKYFNSSKSS